METLALLVPFLAPYPAWVKLLAGAWVALSAVLVISLLFARPPHLPADAPTSSAAEVRTPGKPAEPHPAAPAPTQPAARGAALELPRFRGG